MLRTFCIALMLVSLLGCEKPEVDSAGTHFLAAMEALDVDNTDVALTELDKCIEIEPDAWAYFERARIHAKAGSDDLANRDILLGLKLDKGNAHLKWLKVEMRKSKEKRFAKGDVPPSRK